MKSPIHVAGCTPWPFPPKPGERRRRPSCRWVCRVGAPVQGALFEDRQDATSSAVLHPSTKRLGAWQVSFFDAQGAIRDVVAASCTDVLRAAQLTPGRWRLREAR